MPRLILLIIIFLPFYSEAQNFLAGIITDSKTGESVPFANIVVENGLRGTVSGLDGRFVFERKSSDKIFKISCLGFETAILEVDSSEKFINVKLSPRRYELSEVSIFPGENPALILMKKVYENREKNNPEVACDYQCYIYHKMSFYIDTADIKSMNKEDSAYIFLRDHHFILIESFSEKKHIAPDKDNERIISSRMSGFEMPMFASLPAQMQSFTFYKDNINLLDIIYMNPVSKAGLQRYFFNLEDTLLNARGDTLFYVSFQPRKNSNIKGMEGSFHIHVPSYGIKTVNAKTSEIMYDFSVKQTYQYVDDKQWFPEHLESMLEYKFDPKTPIKAQSKSTITSVNLNPELSKKDFSAITLTDETHKSNLPIEEFRYMPLTAKDSATYQFMDSIFNLKPNMDKVLVNMVKALIEGFIPIGYVKLELDKTLGYNLYEGYRLGAGLWTSDKISEFFSVGGFYYRSFKSKDNNYGAGMKFKISQKADANLLFQWEKRNKATGKIDFLDPRTDFSTINIDNFYTNSMAMTNLLKGSFTTRFLKYFKANLFYEYSEASHRVFPPFGENDDNLQLSDYTLHEYGVKLKWAHKETFTYLYPFGLMSNGTNFPRVWVNASYCSGSEIDDFEYLKLEAQIEKRFLIYESVKSYIRITGGNIIGDAPVSKFYALFGLKYQMWNYEASDYFMVMRPNEFAATRFVNAIWRGTYYTRLNKDKKFKPEITLSTKAGFGDVPNNYRQSVKTYNKGYYESSIYLGNMLRQQYFKYGIGFHYRYGPYSLPKNQDNFAITIGLEFGL